MIDRLIAELGEQLELTAEELADIVWLTLIRQKNNVASDLEPPKNHISIGLSAVFEEVSNSSVSISASIEGSFKNRQQDSAPVAGIVPRRSHSSTNDSLGRLPIKVVNPPSIRDPLALVRSLRPLMRMVPSSRVEGLDEEATAQQIAEAFLWQPIVKPALEPWLDVVLIADESESMPIWKQTVLEFRKLLRNYGTFRDVQLWGLHCEDKQEGKQFKLSSGMGGKSHSLRNPKTLIDPSGRRLILLISDCVADYWQDESMVKLLKLWSRTSPVAIAQVFPEWLWSRTAIRSYDHMLLSSKEAGLPNSRLTARWHSWQAEIKLGDGTFVPIVTLEPNGLLVWSQMMMGHLASPGYRIRAFEHEVESLEPVSLSLKQQIERFQVMSSPIAQRLMGLVAATPSITLPVIRLIQETLLPRSKQMNVTEVLLGGLLQPIASPELGDNELEYGFVDEGIRDLLLKETPVPDTVAVLSKYIEKHFGKSLDDFVADLLRWSRSEDREMVEQARPFATVTAAVLKRKGGKYKDFVRQIEERYAPEPHPYEYPPLQVITFETVFVEIEEENPLEPFDFEIATVTLQTSGKKTTAKISKQEGRAWGYVDRLSEEIDLEMVAIPEGKFIMGSHQDEKDRNSSESPQHEVSVPTFFMGKYAVTQAQYEVVMDENLSDFKGETDSPNKPVENVSWHGAVEFCRRLSDLTGKEFRLPSEAEWEYACRAMTSPPTPLLNDEVSKKIYPPFHFGETITSELANYNWAFAYGNAPKLKVGSKGTTPVGNFKYANAFGLYDLHGNVWEWCEDDWHSDYTGAPTDGSAWIDEPRSKDGRRVRRGGSWVDDPWNCRSAFRLYSYAVGRSISGFRVCCSAPRTP